MPGATESPTNKPTNELKHSKLSSQSRYVKGGGAYNKVDKD